MKFRNLTLAGITIALTACSSGGGGGGGGAGGTTPGFLGAPSATCAGSACLPGASVSLESIHDMAAADPTRAIAVYEAFNNVFIAKINTFLTKVYAAMVAGGSQSCSDVTMGSSGTVNGYSFSITPASKTVPPDFTKAGSNYNYRIYAAVGESRVAEIQVYCGTSTASDPLTVYARVKENGDRYEFVYEKTNNKIRVMGAGVLSSGGRMVAWFKTDDGNDFDLEVHSNVNSIIDQWQARGNKSSNRYYVDQNGGVNTACVDSTGSTVAGCSSLNNPSALSVTVQAGSGWNGIDVSNFTIADP